MEVPGRKLQLEPSAVDTTYCQPCSHDGKSLHAEAYCTVCKEFFCSICASVHKRQKMTRAHALLDKCSMPTSMSGQDDEDEYTTPCEIHPKKFIKYFCPIHQSLNCGHCLVESHQSCHVDEISDISQAFNDGPEYGDIDKAISKLSKDIDDCASDVEKNMMFIAEMGEKEVSKLKRCRDDINNYFDEREKSLLKNIDQMKNIDEALLGYLRTKCDKLRSKVLEIKNKLETQENNTIQLFIEAKRAKTLLEVTQTALDMINKQNTIHQYRFRKDSVTERLMASNTGLGIVEEEVMDAQNTPGEQTQVSVGGRSSSTRGSTCRTAPDTTTFHPSTLQDNNVFEDDDVPANYKTIVLERGVYGLGFCVGGGNGSSECDLPIHVVDVAPKGAASENGQLKCGDHILSVNGVSLKGLTHMEAVNILKNAKGSVIMNVLS